MCGILGFNWKNKSLGEKLGSLLKHRGPDDEGIYLDKNLTLCHRRLSIIDLSKKAKQPMIDKTKNYIISYNGEIFNYLEIKNDLELKGYYFKSKSDTEVLLNGYIEYGEKILQKINGQFAFCIYNKKNKKLFLARDRIGINPLYYYYKNNKFIFGSELKVIMKSGIDKQIDEKSLKYYLLYGFTPKKNTILKDTFKLEPGSYLTFCLKENKILQIKKYWNLHFSEKIKSESKAIQLIRTELEAAVKKRLLSDVEVGAFLSGGIDSSIIVALASKYKKKIKTFSVKFDYNEFDESEYSQQISKLFKTQHEVIKFNYQDVSNLINKLPYYYDEPLGDPSMIPMFLVSKVARKKVTVALSGDGGDELFAGYNSYKHYKLIQLQKYYPKIINNILNKLFEYSNFKKIQTYFEIGTFKEKHKFSAIMSRLSKKNFKKYFPNDNIENYFEIYSEKFTKTNYINNATHSDLNNYISEDILLKVDRASLGNSLESRPPFLDHKLIELALSIKPNLKIKNNESKYLLKKAYEDLIPRNILYRKKKGFGVPLRYYFQKELKPIVEKYVINYSKHDYFPKKLKEEIREILNKKNWEKDHSKFIWSILIFNLWYEEWMN